MSRFIPVLAAASCVVATLGSAASEPGSIAGRVRLKPRIGGAALPSTAYAPRTVSTHAPHPIPEIRNVVVYLKGAAARGALPPQHVQVQQEHETFVPHVLAVTTGSTVDFPNSDPLYHNVFSLSSAATFNLGRYGTGQSRRQTLTKAGVVKVFCQIHSHMSATILVFDHPYFAIPALDGTFELPDVPPGDYTVVGWHERVGERTARVHVEPGQRLALDLALPVEERP